MDREAAAVDVVVQTFGAASGEDRQELWDAVKSLVQTLQGLDEPTRSRAVEVLDAYGRLDAGGRERVAAWAKARFDLQ